MNRMFYEIIEGRFQILGLDMLDFFPPLRFPEKEICKQLRWPGMRKEGVELRSLWGVEKEQMNGLVQMAFKLMRFNASQVKHRWAL